MNRLNNFKFMFITSIIVILIPLFVGLFLWDKLPNQMAMHFDVSGAPDAYYSKSIAVFGMSGLMLVIHIICVCSTAVNSGDKVSIPDKVFIILLWFIPALTICLSAFTYAYNLGKNLNITFWILLILGIMFLVLGNYIPKIKTNHVIGTRIKWTYQSVKNWEHTNRFSGWMLFICGLLFIVLAILGVVTEIPKQVLLIFLIIIAIGLPISMFLYSFIYYKKHNQDCDYYNIN